MGALARVGRIFSNMHFMSRFQPRCVFHYVISKVVLTTTHGAIDIELWGKESPLAVRNFIQLCLEDYYENTIFHRVIKGFMMQGTQLLSMQFARLRTLFTS